MASEEDADIEDIEEELARVEEQLQELERDADEPPEPEAPDPEPDDVDAPEPEEAFEGEPDVGDDPGPFDRVLSQVRSLTDASDDEEAEPAQPDPEPAEPADGEFTETDGPVEAVEDADDSSQDPTEPEEPEDGSSLAFWRSEDEDGEDHETQASEDEASDSDEGPETDDGAGFLSGVRERFGSSGLQADPDELAARGARADRPPAPPAEVSTPTPAEPAETVDEATDEGARASALLARFQGGGSDDPEQPATGEDDDDDRGGILVAALVVILMLAGLAGAAYVYLPGSSSGDDLSANLVADGFTDDQGRYVAVTGEPIELDASASAGTVDEYTWGFGDGTQETTTEPTVQHTYDEGGDYTVEVTITSGDSQDTAQIDVTVVQAPEADASVRYEGQPAASPGTVGNNVFLGETVTLDGSASTADPEHTLSSYTWDIDGDGEPDANGRQAQLSFDETGAWAVNLTVSDDLGNEDQATRIVHVSDRLQAEGTLGPSTVEPDTDSYPVNVDRGRLGVQPVQVEAQLTYNASSGDETVIQPEIETDLDLNLTDPEGNVYQAEDDDGQGEETLMLAPEDLTNLGEWNVTVAQDNQNAGTASEADYELVVTTIY